MKNHTLTTTAILGVLSLACAGGSLSEPIGLGTPNTYLCEDCKIWDVKVVGNTAYVADLKRGLVILDVTDPTQPTELSVTEVEQVNALDASGSHVFVGASMQVAAIDATDPANPSELSTMSTSAGTYGVDIHSGMLFSGGDLIDISNPASPQKKSTVFQGSTSSGYAVSNNIVICARQSSGVSLHDISDPAAPTEVGTLEMSYATEVVVKDNIAFIGDYNDKKVFLVDISNPASPTIVGEALDAGGSATTVESYGDYLVIGSNYGGIQVFDITDPVNPVQKWTAKPDGMRAYKLDANDMGVFVAAQEGGLFFIPWDRGA